DDLLFRKPLSLHQSSFNRGRTLISDGGNYPWQVSRRCQGMVDFSSQFDPCSTRCGHGFGLWLEFVDPAMRQDPEMKAFTLLPYDDRGPCGDAICETDDYAEVAGVYTPAACRCRTPYSAKEF
ncbi:hypothetical protein NKI95_33370, partial [Mesorhizobium sp. M0306]|uniref:hypothetical protein n=1 Tax=Mesorhizobium sp. M0306 TaxID=2956932 RepID=UPI003339746B